MSANGKLYKAFKALASNNTQTVRVQLGPGQMNYFNGWINVDANIFTGKAEVWADLRDPLPFKDSSVDVFYSHHVIEHLPDLFPHFREMYRCLKPGGNIRVGGPNGDGAVKKYLENDAAWFHNFPDDRSSIGGKLENFIFCRQEHLTILTPSYLTEIAAAAGFKNMAICMPTRETNYPTRIDQQVFDRESETDFVTPHTILIEAEK